MAFKALTGLFGSKKPQVKITEDYQRWRELIFRLQPEPVEDAHQVYGVIMDIGHLDQQSSTQWAISMSAFSTGEASFQPTVGGGVIGLGGDPQIAQVAQEIVQMAQGLLPQTNPTKDLSLPEPGFVQFFFLTISGVHGIKARLDQFQKPEHPFLQLLNRFGFIHQSADQIFDQSHDIDTRLKALYVVAFTPAKMDRNELMSVTNLAMDNLKAKNSLFKQRIEGMPPKARLEISNAEFNVAIHTPATMQTLMGDWLQKQFNLSFKPISDNNFFLHGMRNPQGRQNIFLFYFDIES